MFRGLLQIKIIQKNKVIYYIHGGGFTGSCSKERISFISYLVNKFGYNVYSIDYRLAPEFKFPNQLNDCLEGYQFLLKTFDSKNIVLIGESAGGSLVITLSMMLRDKNIPLPKSVYANSPVTQFIEYTASYKRNSLKKDFIVVEGIIDNLMGIYCDKKDIYNPYISPLYGDLRNLPLINLTASYDECLYDDAVMMSDKLKEAKNEGKLITYKGLCHAFIISPQMKKVVKYTYPDLESFLKNNLN